MTRPALDSLLAEGSLAGQAGDFTHAIACFRAALKQSPKHPGVILFLSKALGLSFHYAEAEQLVQKALKLAPQNEQVLQIAAQNYQEWDRPQGALPLLKRAASQHAHSLGAWVQLARALERANQVAEATEAVSRATSLSPRDPEVLRLQARLAQRAGDFPSAETQLCEALELNPGPQTQAEILYCLASTYDSRGEFGQAWKAASRAKELQHAEASRFFEPPEACTNEVERVRQMARIWDTPSQEEVEQKPTVLCGYPRSGTTLLGQIICGHPAVIYADEVLALTRIFRLGENLFDPPRPDWFLHSDSKQRGNLRREYQRCLEAQSGRRIDWTRLCVVDKNPAVTRFLPAFFSVMPGTRVIFPLRDPRDVAVSCYLRPFPVNPFTAHFNSLDRIVKHMKINWTVWQAIRENLPNAALEVRYERVVASRAETGQKVCAFLGIDPAVLPEDHAAVARKSFINSPTYAEVLQPLHPRAVGRWHAYESQLGPQMTELGELARRQGYD